MPILHVQYDAKRERADGTVTKLAPSVALRQSGPIFQTTIGLARSIADAVIQTGAKIPAPLSGNALIDTGASVTCIDNKLAQKLELPVIDIVEMTSASHSAIEQNVYPVEIEITGSPIRLEVLRAMGANLEAQGLIALIGRDFLQHCTVHYNGVTGAITLAI